VLRQSIAARELVWEAVANSDHDAVSRLIAQKNSAPLDLPPAGTALVVVDLQRAFVQPDGRFPELMEVLAPEAIDGYCSRITNEVVPNARRLIAAFHEAQLPIAYTGAGTRTGDGSDLTGWLRAFDDIARQVIGKPVWPTVSDLDWAIDSSIADKIDGIVVEKTTADPFISTDLEARLHSLSVNTVVVCGLTTDVCVASTARGAADRNFETIVVQDACTTLSEQLHRASLDIIGLAFGRLASTDQIIEIVGGSAVSST
jgi:nicotinamidase-related amidase